MRGKGLLTLRAFTRAFAASFLLLSAGAAFAVRRFTRPPDPGSGDSGTVSDVPGAYVPREEDMLTLLLIGSDESGGAPSRFTLLRLDVLNGGMPVFSFPGGTIFEYSGRRAPISGIASSHGPETACSAVASGFSIRTLTAGCSGTARAATPR